LSSLIFSALYATWGLGLFGTVSRATAIASIALPVAIMLLWSPMWLRRFDKGPLEWLWRNLARLVPA
ncbi:MAG: DUF418 domain-containing protein, partial [Sphingomonadaceae bacterium]